MLRQKLKKLPKKTVSKAIKEAVKAEDKPSKPDESLIATDYMTPEQLALNIQYLINPANQDKKEFPKRKSNMYAYAFMNKNRELIYFLENRFGELQIQDKEIVINLVPLTSDEASTERDD